MTHTNFLGIPVDGVITPGTRVPQRPREDLRPMLRALLYDDGIAEFGWMQYTPYFNDGEPCVFDISDFWARTSADGGLSIEALGVGTYCDPHPSLGHVGHEGYGDASIRLPYVGTDEERYLRVRALADALDSGAFCDVLLEAFGDHAKVLVRRTGITVEFYKHH
jgi:hypothetical protein